MEDLLEEGGIRRADRLQQVVQRRHPQIEQDGRMVQRVIAGLMESVLVYAAGQPGRKLLVEKAADK